MINNLENDSGTREKYFSFHINHFYRAFETLKHFSCLNIFIHN